MGRWVRHESCENCGSSDAKAVYEDGSGYCWSCRTYYHSDGEQMDAANDGQGRTAELVRGEHNALPKRGILGETAERYDYQSGKDSKGAFHAAIFRDGLGRPVAQKLRREGKQFSWVGDKKSAETFYGQHLWKNGGKYLTITEGEIDCLSVAQAFNLKYPVVSLPDGAQSAIKAVKSAYDWLDQFERIVLCFDMDEQGQKAAAEVAEFLPPGKVYIMALNRKDANDVLVNDGSAPIVRAFWDAKEWRPDGIIVGSELSLEDIRASAVKGWNLPWPIINDKLGGIREGELTLLTAGSGIGKSTVAREIVYSLHKQGATIGNIFLEESVAKTAQAYVAIDNNVRARSLREDPSILTDQQWRSSFETILRERMLFYDHFGSLDSERLLAKMRYMRKVYGCNFVVLDHISIVISGQESSKDGERKDIDRLMTNLRCLVEETGLGVIAIVHLRQPEGKPHEEGGRVTLSQLRGSGSLKQLSDVVWALERNQQGNDPNLSQIRILKDRNDGQVGEADLVVYNEQGRLVSVDETSQF